MNSIFVCPICRKQLQQNNNSLKCLNGHCFDFAKSGYVNLLISNVSSHGDSKQMISARKNFLDKGYYEPLAKSISSKLYDSLPNGALLLDAGCGDCYYSSYISDYFSKFDKQINICGFDISKDAANYGIKRMKKAEIAVASAYDIPIADKSVNGVLCVFSPAATSEFRRVLSDNGILIMAIGGENHLWSLKQTVYDNPYKNKVNDYDLDGFIFEGSNKLEYSINLTCNDDIKNLFSMTPYAHKTSKEDIKKLDLIDTLTTEISFEILKYRKKIL